jgi:hypothetical protein
MSRRDLVSGGDVMADNTSPVVVGVDGSFTAIGQLAAVAASFAAPLLIVHAKPGLLAPPSGPARREARSTPPTAACGP